MILHQMDKEKNQGGWNSRENGWLKLTLFPNFGYDQIKK